MFVDCNGGGAGGGGGALAMFYILSAVRNRLRLKQAGQFKCKVLIDAFSVDR